MRELLFTPLAKEDLQQIWGYLAENVGTEAANKFLTAIRSKCLNLAEFPESGRMRYELLIELRSFPFRNHIIFYLPIDEGIEVLRIIHSSRDIQQAFDEMILLEP